jgi:hypothetical protein
VNLRGELWIWHNDRLEKERLLASYLREGDCAVRHDRIFAYSFLLVLSC